jgi:hypothetical protein
MRKMITLVALAAVSGACAVPSDDLGRVEQAATCSYGQIKFDQAFASSTNSGSSAAQGIDRKTSTTWDSAGGSSLGCNQWFEGKLASSQSFDKIVIRWGGRGGPVTSYEVFVDGTKVYANPNAKGGSWAVDTINLGSMKTGQSVKVVALACGNTKPFAMSIAELEIHGTVCTTCTDGEQNGDETGTDCGGSCPACPPTSTCDVGLYAGATGSCFAGLPAWEEHWSDPSVINIDWDPNSTADTESSETKWTASYDATWPDNRCVSSKANVKVDTATGELILHIRKQSFTFPSNYFSYYEQKVLSGTKDCTNSEVRHRKELGPYGFMEASIKPPAYSGYIAGFFSFNFGDDVSPSVTTAPGYKNPWLEFDHELTGNYPNDTLVGLITAKQGCGVYGCTWNDQTYVAVGKTHGVYRRYGLGWTPTELTYWVDGMKVRTLTKLQVEAAALSDPDAIFPQEALTYIFNFWVFNTQNPNPKTFGGKYSLEDFTDGSNPAEDPVMKIDYVKWWNYTP